MDADIKQAFKVLGDKVDAWREHQEEVCELHRKPLEDHVKDGPRFRDKMVKLCTEVATHRVLLFLMVTGCVGGFWWLLRK